MYQNGINVVPITSSVTAGVANTFTIVPSSWSDPFTTGTQNGQIIGTEITPKYLNCKVKLNFDFLRRVVYMGPNGTDPHIQRYDISMIQGWVKKDLRCHLNDTLTNAQSGWTLPSFTNKASYDLALTTMLKQELYNNSIAPEFLMYRQKTASNIIILKRIKVKGALDENLVTDSSAGGLQESAPENVTPEQNFSFNWDLSKYNKTKMTPVGRETAVPEHTLGYSWVPFVQILVGRRVAENRDSHEGGDPSAPAIPNFARSFLNIKSVNHFTYADA
jgi:hypothetical protein